MDYISPGMKTQLRLQGFAADSIQLEQIKKIYLMIGNGFAAGSILLGAKKASGAGRFKVSDVNDIGSCYGKSLTLDLREQEQLNQYLDGVEACFTACTDENLFNDSDIRIQDAYVLKAFAPSGLLVGGGGTESNDFDVDKVNMYRLLGESKEYYIPGSTFKGILRSYAEMAAGELNIPSQVLDEIYGCAGKGLDDTGKMTGSSSRVLVRDCLLKKPAKAVHNRIKIDRWLGSAMNGAKMNSEVLYLNQEPMSVEVYISGELDQKKRKIANALTYLALRDMGAGLITVGSGRSVGHGRLCGQSITINDIECKFTGNQIDLGKQKTYIEECFKELEEYGK